MHGDVPKANMLRWSHRCIHNFSCGHWGLNLLFSFTSSLLSGLLLSQKSCVWFCWDTGDEQRFPRGTRLSGSRATRMGEHESLVENWDALVWMLTKVWLLQMSCNSGWTGVCWLWGELLSAVCSCSHTPGGGVGSSWRAGLMEQLEVLTAFSLVRDHKDPTLPVAACTGCEKKEDIKLKEEEERDLRFETRKNQCGRDQAHRA